MKYYMCDNCGEIQPEKFGQDLFVENGWTREYPTEDGSPPGIGKIIDVKHYCPVCSNPSPRAGVNWWEANKNGRN